MNKDLIEIFPNQEKRQKDFKCSIGFAMTVIGGILITITTLKDCKQWHYAQYNILT